MEYGVLSVILVIVVAFLAGLEGILDQWQFHQPIIACSLIGIVTGHASAGIILGGSLQLIALGWANVGAAVAPDAALASVASSILMVQSNNFDLTHIMGTIVPAAILLATAGLVLTTLVRMLSVVLVHQADRAAENVALHRAYLSRFAYCYPCWTSFGYLTRCYPKSSCCYSSSYLWRSCCRWWDGCCRWLCNGYQPYGYS